MEISVQMNAPNAQNDFAFVAKNANTYRGESFTAILDRAIADKTEQSYHSDSQIFEEKNSKNHDIAKSHESQNDKKTDPVSNSKSTEQEKIEEEKDLSQEDEKNQLAKNDLVIPVVTEEPLFINSDLHITDSYAGVEHLAEDELLQGANLIDGESEINPLSKILQTEKENLESNRFSELKAKAEASENHHIEDENTLSFVDEENLLQKENQVKDFFGESVSKEDASNAPILAEAQENSENQLNQQDFANKVQSGEKSTQHAQFTVVDERTPKNESLKAEKISDFNQAVTIDADGNAELVMNLNESATNALTETPAEKVKSTFASMLSREIQNNSQSFVKTGLITLRDGNAGSINLILRPEELGNVKINLELADKVLTGKIVVASEEAYNAFKNNLDSLKAAFAESGFEGAGFELSWGGGQNENNHQEDNKNIFGDVYQEAQPFFADYSEDSAYSFGYYSSNYSTVNVMI
ncbi:MAG: flagellar hook-length control protein FliK [Treponemataceae bacterium]